MDLRSNSVDPTLVEELAFGGRTMDFTADEVYTGSDGRVFVSGVITDSNTLVDRQYFIEVTGQGFEGFADKNWKEQQALFDEKIEGIIQQKVSEGQGAFTISKGEEFADIETSIKESAAPPEPVRAPEPEGPKPANLEAGEPIKISNIQGEPELIEGFELDGRKGDLVVHDIEFDNGKPFLSGTFSVGSESHEFAVAIDADRFPDVTQLTNDQVKLLTGPDGIKEMLASGQHPIVLSTGEGFSNRAKILSDINGIQSVANGGFNGDIPYLARLGQDYPELVDTMRLFENSYAPLGREDGMIKIAIVEHLGIADMGLRAQLIDQTNDLGDFAQKLNQRTDLFSRGDDTRAAVEQMAKLADSAVNFNRPVKLGAGARMFAGLTGVGTAMTAGAAAASTYEGSSMEELTHQQFLNKDITEAQRDALLEFHANTTQAQLGDAAVGAVDQFVLPSLLVTFTVELGAREALTKAANETGLPENIYQMHARSMFGGHTASHTAILEAAAELPSQMEGQPEILHGAIHLNNSLKQAQVELTNFRTPYSGMAHVPDDIQDKIEAREGLVAGLQERLVGEMDALMRDPASFEAFMNLMPVNDRMAFVKALATADDNLAADHPNIANALKDFVDGRGGGQLINNQIMAAQEALKADNGAELNAYIASRIMPETSPENAPTETWDDELVAQYYDPVALNDISGVAEKEFSRVSVEGLQVGAAPQLDIAADAKASLLNAPSA